MSIAPDGLALLASGLWGTSDFIGGSLSRRLRTLHVLAGSQAVATVLVLGATVVLGVGDVTGRWAAWSVAAGVSWGLGMAAFYTALAVGTMGVVAPIASVGAVVPVAVGLIQGERPGWPAVTGAVAAVLGVALAAGPDGGGAGSRRRAAVWLAVLTAALFGVEICSLAEGSRASVILTLLGMRVSALACTGLALARLPRLAGRRRPTRHRWHGRHCARHRAPGYLRGGGYGGRHRAPLPRPSGRDMAAVLALGVLDAGATAAYAVATRGGLVSLVAVLASLYPAVTILLARRVHAERLTRAQWGGVVAVLGGAGVIACSGA